MIPTLWHCANTEPQRERIALASIRSMGFTAYLPEFTEEKPRAPQSAPCVRPLFPSYLFVAFDPDEREWPVLATLPGVRRLFGHNPERPTPLAEGVVEALMVRLSMVPEPDAPRPIVSVGAIGRVLDGPLKNFQGVCLWSSDQRAVLFNSLMGFRTTVAQSRIALVPG